MPVQIFTESPQLGVNWIREIRYLRDKKDFKMENRRENQEGKQEGKQEGNARRIGKLPYRGVQRTEKMKRGSSALRLEVQFREKSKEHIE